MTFKLSSRVVLGLAAVAAGVLVSDWAFAQAAAPAAADAAPAAAAAAAPLTVNQGDNAWMLTSSVLVLLMTIPGLALFYGGLVRSKNMLSVLMHVFYTVCIVCIIWVLYGYSMAFTGGSTPYVGGFSKAFLMGVNADSQAATFSAGVTIHEYIYICFQMTFAAITPALIVGAFAERMKFSALALFIPLWVTFIYFPIAHMVWYWGGPDAIVAAAAELAKAAAGPAKEAAQAKLDAALADAGQVFIWGAIDFAGGTVVHILSAVGRLVRLQRRIEPRSQRRRSARHDQFVRRHRSRCARVDVRRMDGQG
jgi:Amt family ammonium transporter